MRAHTSSDPRRRPGGNNTGLPAWRGNYVYVQELPRGGHPSDARRTRGSYCQVIRVGVVTNEAHAQCAKNSQRWVKNERGQVMKKFFKWEYRDGKGDKIMTACTHSTVNARNSQPKRINATSPILSHQTR